MTDLKTCCELTWGVIDGQFGWVWQALAIVFLVIVTNFFFKWFLKFLHKRFIRQDKVWKDSFIRALYKPLSYYVWFFALIQGVDLIWDRLEGVHFFEDAHQILEIGAILALAWFFMRWKNNVINWMIIKSRRHEIASDQSKIDVMNKLATILILFVSLTLLLEQTGRSMNTLIAFGGVSGLAVAFASQQLIANFFGGLMIYVTQPFAIGDWIKLPEKNVEGHVEEIGWYMTRIRTFDKRPVYIPNSMLTNALVMTPSRMSHRQFKETIGLRYQDLAALKPIIQDIRQMLIDHKEVDTELKPLVRLDAFNTYSIDITISAYTTSLDGQDFARIKEDILFKIADVIGKHKAEMAFPTSVVNLPTPIQTEPESC